MDNPLISQKIRVERKQFFFDLKENASGRFIRITEDVFGRRDTIILPTSGLADFMVALEYFAQELEALGENIVPTPAEPMPPEVAVPQPDYYANPIGAGHGR
ncbi:MAG: RNA-binding protein [Kiritimatiellia bacterium]